MARVVDATNYLAKDFANDSRIFLGDNFMLYWIDYPESTQVVLTPQSKPVTFDPSLFRSFEINFEIFSNFVIQRRLVCNRDGRCYSRISTADTGKVERLFFYGEYELKKLKWKMMTVDKRLEVVVVDADEALRQMSLERLHYLRAKFNDRVTNERNLELIEADKTLLNTAVADLMMACDKLRIPQKSVTCEGLHGCLNMFLKSYSYMVKKLLATQVFLDDDGNPLSVNDFVKRVVQPLASSVSTTGTYIQGDDLEAYEKLRAVLMALKLPLNKDSVSKLTFGDPSINSNIDKGRLSKSAGELSILKKFSSRMTELNLPVVADSLDLVDKVDKNDIKLLTAVKEKLLSLKLATTVDSVSLLTTATATNSTISPSDLSLLTEIKAKLQSLGMDISSDSVKKLLVSACTLDHKLVDLLIATATKYKIPVSKILEVLTFMEKDEKIIYNALVAAFKAQGLKTSVESIALLNVKKEDPQKIESIYKLPYVKKLPKLVRVPCTYFRSEWFSGEWFSLRCRSLKVVSKSHYLMTKAWDSKVAGSIPRGEVALHSWIFEGLEVWLDLSLYSEIVEYEKTKYFDFLSTGEISAMGGVTDQRGEIYPWFMDAVKRFMEKDLLAKGDDAVVTFIGGGTAMGADIDFGDNGALTPAAAATLFRFKDPMKDFATLARHDGRVVLKFNVKTNRHFKMIRSSDDDLYRTNIHSFRSDMNNAGKPVDAPSDEVLMNLP